MCRYFCTEFIDFMLKGRSFLEYANLFSTNDFLVFAPVLNLLLLDDNKKVPNWISTGVSAGKMKPFNVNLALTMTNL